jgi:hypothetical protein
VPLAYPDIPGCFSCNNRFMYEEENPVNSSVSVLQKRLNVSSSSSGTSLYEGAPQ